MSIGIGAFAKLALEDEEMVIYEYGCFNWNEKSFRNEERIHDGIITIQRNCFLEPIIREKRKRMPSGKKKIVIKLVPVTVDYKKYIEEGLITVENCSNCWRTTDDEKGVDVMVMRVLCHIFHEYQQQGEMPKSISIFS